MSPSREGDRRGRQQLDSTESLQRADQLRAFGGGYELGQQAVKARDARTALVDRVKRLLQHTLLRRVLEGLLLDPLDVRLGPVALRPAPILAQEKLQELVAGSKLSALGVLSAAQQIAHRFARFVRDVDRDQVARAQVVGQSDRIPPIGLDSIARGLWHLRGRDHIALDSQLGQPALEAVAGRSGFIGAVKLFPRPQPVQNSQEADEVIGRGGEKIRLAPALLGNCDGDRLGVDVEAHEACRIRHGAAPHVALRYWDRTLAGP
jgi:hypothetical protein